MIYTKQKRRVAMFDNTKVFAVHTFFSITAIPKRLSARLRTTKSTTI
ncbi:MAG: hypothetical protein L6V93_14595 [Clostridiales bacterium]|nr:MAG: hypothetical protein L6V93_14595 [Clostridiales bacterium]